MSGETGSFLTERGIAISNSMPYHSYGDCSVRASESNSLENHQDPNIWKRSPSREVGTSFAGCSTPLCVLHRMNDGFATLVTLCLGLPSLRGYSHLETPSLRRFVRNEGDPLASCSKPDRASHPCESSLRAARYQRSKLLACPNASC